MELDKQFWKESKKLKFTSSIEGNIRSGGNGKSQESQALIRQPMV